MRKFKSWCVGLNRQVFVLGLISFFADVASEMLYPIMPIFLTTVLGAPVWSLGVIEGMAEAISAFMKLLSGVWSDRLQKRKPFLWMGYLLAAISKPLIGLSSTWTMVLFSRALDRMGKGMRTAPRDALLDDLVEPQHRGKAFGVHRAMDTAGAVLGPLLALYLLNSWGLTMRQIFIWALLPGLASTLVVLLVKENKSPVRVLPVENKIKKWNWSILPTDLKKFLYGWGIFSFCNSSDAFLLLRASEMKQGIAGTVMLYCFYTAVFALSSPLLGSLSDRVDRKSMLLAGLLLFSVLYLGFALTDSYHMMFLLFALYGVFNAATDGLSRAYVLDIISADSKATAVGWLLLVSGLGSLFAGIIGGFLWQQFGYSATFLFGSIGALASFLYLSIVGPRAKRSRIAQSP